MIDASINQSRNVFGNVKPSQVKAYDIVVADIVSNFSLVHVVKLSKGERSKIAPSEVFLAKRNI